MSLSVVLAQLNWRVGDIEANTNRMLALIEQHAQQDLIICSELALCGYPPEDLLLRHDFQQRCAQQLTLLAAACQDVALIVGHPYWQDGKLYNALSLLAQGQQQLVYCKQLLPNYDVFDELRYFTPGQQSVVVELKGQRLGLLICEDLWQDGPIDALKTAGAELVIVINASPFEVDKPAKRRALVQAHCQRTHLPLIYVNQIGGQDELVFDGQSFVCNAEGQVVYQLAAFAEQVSCVEIPALLQQAPLTNLADDALAQIYAALVLAVKDYVTKNGFDGIVLGLSGGIDSALTLAIAVDALGKERAQAVMMPFRYTADISVEDARLQAEKLGVEFDIISIEPMFDAFMQQLAPLFAGSERDTTEENLQARCRGVVLMALSNKRRRLVLTTGNKSEMSVGYATLYGDMAGGFDVLKDVPKTVVFELAKWRNRHTEVIPNRVITRPPSAELAPDQKDEDSLPPYEILDPILQKYVEQDYSVAQLLAEGFDEAVVRRVIKLVDINEYKRRQSAVGPKITARNYGKGRRYPISSGFGYKNWTGK